MRLLHTSDWHLGRTLHGLDLHEAQRAVLAQICELVSNPLDGIAIDAVLIAGDIYDRAVPPVESVLLLGEVLATLTRHTTVIITAGNHDSAIRLGFGADLFTDRLHLRTELATIGDPVMLPGLLIYPLPYLDPDHARVALARPGTTENAESQPLERSHQAVLNAAMDLIRTDLAGRQTSARSVVMAHLFICDSAAADSERPISVGGIDSVRASTFDGVDYVALGHLHGPQRPAPCSDTVLHYSGSPLRYSFSERGHTKSVSLVDLPQSGPVKITEVPLAQPRAMLDLSGELDEILNAARTPEQTASWVRVTVTDRARPERMHDRLRATFPNLLQALHVPAGSADFRPTDEISQLQSPTDLAADFVRYVSRAPISAAELLLFEQAFERAATAETGA